MPYACAKQGISVVPGIAVGTAVVWKVDPAPRSTAGALAEERARLARGIAGARRGVEDLIRLLPRSEVELFEPELMILDELAASLDARLADGMRAEDAVSGTNECAAVDLLLDARARILDAMAHDHRTIDAHLEGCEGDVVLVVEILTPSIVASLPAQVVGIVTSTEDVPTRDLAPTTSHAAILARGRDIPLAVLQTRDMAAIEERTLLVVDATEGAARVLLCPADHVADEHRARRKAWIHARAEEEEQVALPLDHLGIEVLVNVGSLHERIPASADGVGLIRTELLFSDRANLPGEAEQFGALCAIGNQTARSHVVVRLFDGGGDKVIPWLSAPPSAPQARGIELLLCHPAVLEMQLRAIVRARERRDLRVLIPFARSAADVVAVRARVRARIPVGALIETADAVDRIEEIADSADFISIGTNDLSSSITGSSRASAGLSLDPRLLRAVERVVLACQARSQPVTVCGEMAGDPHGARVLAGLGARALSVAPARVAPVKLALRGASRSDCAAIAREALKTSEAPGR